MNKENNNSNFVLLSIVALVAIVGLIIGMQGNSKSITLSKSNLANGEAYKYEQGQPMPVKQYPIGHWEYEGNFTVNSSTISSVDNCSYFWDNYDPFHEGGVDYIITSYYNNSNSSNSSNSTNSTYEDFDTCESEYTLKEYSCEYNSSAQKGASVVVTEGYCSEGCYENSTYEHKAYCKKTKVWVSGNQHYLLNNPTNNNNYALN